MWRTCLVLVVLLSAGLAEAQSVSRWVGQRVVTKYGTALRTRSQVVYVDTVFRTYQVRREQGDWLWLVTEGIAGWVQNSEVLPVAQAIDYYTKQITANPGSASLYVFRGLNWNSKGEMDKAIADYTRAIRLDPKDAVAFFSRGNAWWSKHEYDNAIGDYTEAIRLEPKFPGLFYSRGIAWQDKNEFDRAISDYTEAIRLDPNFAGVFYCRGLARHAKNQIDQAIADYTEAIRLDPDLAVALNNRGNLWSIKKDFGKAIHDHSEAIRLNPRDASAFNNRGNAWRNRRDYEKAIADYNDAIGVDPTFALALHNRAVLWATCSDGRFRNGKKAVESATRACELTGWKEPHHITALAAACAEVGDFAAAVKWQETAQQLFTNPDDRKESETRLRIYRDGKPFRL